MGKKTDIPWCDATWNPWYGCMPRSEACENCYARTEMKRYGIDPNVVQQSKTTFLDPRKWARNESLPAGSRIFTCSWSDFFITQADAWRANAWEIIRQTPEYKFLILTKRPERIWKCLPAQWGSGWSNVWLGITAETQEHLDTRMWHLNTVHGNKFVSMEPVLGALDLGNWIGKINWVIAGGENGPHSRPTHQDWVRDLAGQCDRNKIPFFFKGWGQWLPVDQQTTVVPEAWLRKDPVMRYVKAGTGSPPYPGSWFNAGAEAGDLLDGKQYHQTPFIQPPSSPAFDQRGVNITQGRRALGNTLSTEVPR